MLIFFGTNCLVIQMTKKYSYIHGYLFVLFFNDQMTPFFRHNTKSVAIKFSYFCCLCDPEQSEDETLNLYEPDLYPVLTDWLHSAYKGTLCTVNLWLNHLLDLFFLLQCQPETVHWHCDINVVNKLWTLISPPLWFLISSSVWVTLTYAWCCSSSDCQ